MVKKAIKIYLEEDDIRRLRVKAKDLGFEGRGSLIRLLEKLSRESILFLDSNARTMLQALNLKSDNA